MQNEIGMVPAAGTFQSIVITFAVKSFFESKCPNGKWVVVANHIFLKNPGGVGPKIFTVKRGNQLIFIKISVIVPVYKMKIFDIGKSQITGKEEW